MLTQFFQPIFGGEEQIVKDLSFELTRRGHEVAIATLWHEGFQDYEIDQGVRIFRIHSTTQRAAWLYTDTQRRHAPGLTGRRMLRRVLLRFSWYRHFYNWLMYSLPLKWQASRLILLA
jgi:hypothetical protein